jgi:hypothetical protein
MAEHWNPEVEAAIGSFDERMAKHEENLRDLELAIESSDNLEDIVSDWESRRLLRTIPEEARPS